MANKIRGEIKEYDIIVVGTGAGNIVLEHAMEDGLKAAQVEKGKFGGNLPDQRLYSYQGDGNCHRDAERI